MISIDRAKKIIQCYGGDPNTWPEHERKEILQLLLDSKRLTDMQQQALAIDSFFGLVEQKTGDLNYRPGDQLCADRILSNLPVQQREIQQITLKFLPEGDAIRHKLRSTLPVLLVAVVVMIVQSLSNSLQRNQQTQGHQFLTMAEYMAVYVEDYYITDEEYIPINDEQLEILAFLEPQIIDENI